VSFLLDTNVVSELRKSQCDPAVAAWFASVSGEPHYISVLVLGEIRRGITRLQGRDAQQARVLEAWLDQLATRFASRVLPIDAAVADRWARFDPARPVPVQDGLMAATALVHDLTLATRNVNDVAGTDVRVVDPWQHR
jgi:predicted nucleic acid-binding protein